MQWSLPTENLGYKRAYTFGYDGMNRLTDSIYCGMNGTSAATGTTGLYNETMDYDKEGNFADLNRWDKAGKLNQLTFAGNGNQLKSVADGLSVPLPYGSEAFSDKVKVTTEYTYDPNGNMTYDGNTGISTIRYNVLNLPDTIQFVAGHQNYYTYDAGGKKLEVENITSRNILNLPQDTITRLTSSTTLTTDYCGNAIYQNSSLKEILTPTGYWQNGIYYYYLKDHQGNNREVLSQTKQVVEYSDYYPDGMRFEASTSDTSALPYRYNGKELEAMNGLNQYDYGARRRETGIPVWTTMDPLCEKYYSVSPYAYVRNNPILLIDPDGRFDWNTLKQFSYGFCKTLDGIITSSDPIALYNSGKTLATGVANDINAHNYSDAGKKLLNATGVPSLIETGKQALRGNPQAIGTLTAVATVAVAAKNVGGEAASALEKAGATAESGGRVFWSGGGNEAVEAAARTFATDNGMTTLEMTKAGENLTNLTQGMSWTKKAPMWQRLSSQFAKGANGTVHVFQNAGGIGAKSVWGTVEYPILQQNGVNIIYHIVP